LQSDETSADHKLLAEKLAERDRLQQEIDALCEKLRTGEQICVELQMWEVDVAEMRKLGIAVELGANDYRSSRGDEKLQGFLKQLGKNGFARQLSAPKLVTMSGRPASFFVGTESPISVAAGSVQAVQYVEYGTRLDLLPVALGNDRVRVDVRAKVSAGGEPPLAPETEGRPAPSIESLQCDTTVEMTYGETLLLTGLSSRRVVAKEREGRLIEELHEIQTLMVLTANRLPSKVTQLPREVRHSTGE
jgi:Flp pilus assembly secretin CpaC